MDKLIECKNTRCWAHSTFHGNGCMLNLINGCETNGVACKQSENYTASIVIHTLELEIEKLKNELQLEKDRSNALELVASKPCKDCEYMK